tara:strand:- start:34 stop:183 length:150 start_codon:yes stop_codon:yes gene_type:complete
MVVVSYFDIAILALVSVILGMVVALAIKELPRKKVTEYRKKHWKKVDTH